MLAYTQGGAGTPQGATAQMGNPLGEAGTSAKEAAMAVAQFKQLQTQNQLTYAQAGQSIASANLADSQARTETERQALLRAETAREEAKNPGYKKFGELTNAQTANYDATARQARANAARQEAELPYSQSIGKAYTDVPNGVLIEKIAQTGGSAFSSAAEIARAIALNRSKFGKLNPRR
jgi:thymidine phosphorylase